MVSAARSGSTLGYTYDSWGRRITRSLNGSKVWYYYDGDNVVMERDAGKNVLARYDYGSGTDEVLCLYKGLSTYYYHADGQGSTGMVTDASQNVVERYRYDVFGLVQIHNGAGSVIAASAVGNRYLYTGREWEPEIRMYHYRARMYHPVLGRFLQRDPIGFGDDFNLYRYVKNSPVNFVDPNGLCGERLAEFLDGFNDSVTFGLWDQWGLGEGIDQGSLSYGFGHSIGDTLGLYALGYGAKAASAYDLVFWQYKRAGGGGVNILNSSTGKRVIGFDWHRIFVKGKEVYRPHIDIPGTVKHWPW